jgi:nucleoside-diphosphate-sugar epimerase
MKTVLLTGARGALGQAVNARLRREGRYHVVATSRRGEDASGLQLDVCDRHGVAAAIDRFQPDWVLHLAATFAPDFEEAYRVNVEATRHLLETVKAMRAPVRVVLVGSAAEYGAVRPEENPVSENRKLDPVSTYGLTKAWQTQLAGLYASRGIDVVVARIFNLDGPGVSERLFVGRLRRQIEEVLAGRRSAIETGPLSAVRDYVGTDEAAGQVLAIAGFAEPGRVYHVASGIPVAMRDLLHRYLSTYKLDAAIVHEAARFSDREGYDSPAIYADITSIRQLMRTGREKAQA